MSVTINSPGFNTEIVVAIPQQNNVNLVFSSNQIKKFYGQFGAPPLSDSSEIRIGTVTLFMGNETQCCIVLRFPAAGKETNLLHRLYPEIQLLQYVMFLMCMYIYIQYRMCMCKYIYIYMFVYIMELFKQ